MIDFSGE